MASPTRVVYPANTNGGINGIVFKIACASITLVCLLVGVVWATTWKSTVSEVDRQREQINRITEKQTCILERLVKIETLQEENKRMLVTLLEKFK